MNEEGVDTKAMAAEAKARGNTLYSKKTREGYAEALKAYREAIELDPTEHVYHANACACHIELGGDEYRPREKVECFARALAAARQCTALGPEWQKGFLRQATAELELVAATVKWEQRKRDDAKRRQERQDRAASTPAEAGAETGAGAEVEAETDIHADADADAGSNTGGEPAQVEEEEPEEPPLSPELAAVVASAGHSGCEASCRRGLALDQAAGRPASEALKKQLQALRDTGHITDAGLDAELVDAELAAKAKAAGNESFKAKAFKPAIEAYTLALAHDPFNHVFYSNRSACHAELFEADKALADANKCIALKPDFAKGYNRKGVALFHLGQYPDAQAAVRSGLEVDPANAGLKELLAKVQVETREPPGVQAAMHKLREDKRRDAELQKLISQLNMGGGGVQMFNPGSFGGLGGAGFAGGGGLGGLGGGASNMSEDQMRQMARAMGGAAGSTDRG